MPRIVIIVEAHRVILMFIFLWIIKVKNNAITQTKLQLSSAQQQFIQSCNELIREEHDQFQNMIHHYNTAKLAKKNSRSAIQSIKPLK